MHTKTVETIPSVTIEAYTYKTSNGVGTLRILTTGIRKVNTLIYIYRVTHEVAKLYMQHITTITPVQFRASLRY